MFQYHTACPVIDQVLGKPLECRHLMKDPNQQIWETVFSNDLGRLTKGIEIRVPTWNTTISFIHPSDIPFHKKVTYGCLVVNICPLKEEKYHVRLTVGGDRLKFFGNTSSEAASLSTVKILLNSVVFTPNAIFSTTDIKDFSMAPSYLNLNI